MNTFQYHYDEPVPENASFELFDPPIDQLYPENYSHYPKLLDSSDSSDQSAQLQYPPHNIPEADITEISIRSTHDNSIRSNEETKMESSKRKRIKEKITKAKEKFPEKTKLIKKEETLSKREKQLVRNRLSAQRSRDNKKKEMQELKDENINLRIENQELQKQLDSANSNLNLMQRIIDSLSIEAKAEFDSLKSKFDFSPNKANDENLSFRSRPKNSLKNPIVLASLLISCVCLIACLTPIYLGSSPNVPQAGVYAPSRLLVSPSIKYNKEDYINYHSLDELQ